MKRIVLALAVLSLLFSGCSIWNRGKYYSVTPHEEQVVVPEIQDIMADDYAQLCAALENFVEKGVETAVIAMPYYDAERVESDLKTAILHIRKEYPVGAYAVEEIEYEIGTSSGVRAAAVEITYLHDTSEIQRIQQAENMTQAQALIRDSLDSCSADIVIQVEKYEATDLVQFVEDYAMDHPETVMETPRVTVNVYPKKASETKIVELKYTYETSRDTLRSMRAQVQPVFDSAVLYVSGDADNSEKYLQLYSFLVERYDYQIQTSITPAYSLLRHGVGDSEAFATVYAAMCTQAGLDCRVVSGTCEGEAWYWNVIFVDGCFHHLDLVRCMKEGGFRLKNDSAMEGYVWDYARVPVCNAELPEPTDPIATEPSGTDEPSQTKPPEEMAAPSDTTVPETTAQTPAEGTTEATD